jgi:hypothetical protein
MKTMKKLLTATLTLALALTLWGCEFFGGGETTTTAQTTGANETPTSPAAMEPLQGGPMLYTFYGSEAYTTETSDYDGEEYPVYPLGLIDREGKRVSAPVYHKAEYVYDESGRQVIGLIAVKDREFTLYQLDGESRALPCDGYRIDVYPGGRYATVRAAEYGGLFSENADEPLKDGLYDIENGRWVIEPKDGQMIQYCAGGVALGYQYDSGDATGDEVAQWAFSCADESVRELPMKLGRVQEYYPETGWFGAMWTEGEWENRYYDRDLKLLPQLTGWSVSPEGFSGGAYAKLYNNSSFPDVETWVNRQGKIVELQHESIFFAGKCYLAGNQDLWQEKQGALLDAGLNELFKTGPDEHFAVLWRQNQTDGIDGVLLLDSGGAVKAAFDENGKPFADTGAFRCWVEPDIGNVTAFALQSGKWRVLDLMQYSPQAGSEPYVRALALCEEYIVVEAGDQWYSAEAQRDTFAVNWEGGKIDDCPLEPFFSRIGGQTAGEQGFNYFWVEQEDGKRGYINLKGEWLFIDE